MHFNLFYLAFMFSYTHTVPVTRNKAIKKLEMLQLLLKNYNKRSMLTSNAKRQIVKCVQMPFLSLLDQYKRQTGNSPLYVAAIKEEAILFPNLMWSFDVKKKYAIILDKTIDKYRKLKDSSDPQMLLKYKNYIATKLNASVSNSIGNFNNIKRQVKDSCIEPGYEENGVVNLCRRCTKIIKLSADK